jgi:prepilin peptidase CpaA
VSIGPNAFVVAAVAVAALGAWFDFRSARKPAEGEGTEGEIPNWLTLGALAISPLAYFAWGFFQTNGGVRVGLEYLGLSLLGAILCGLVPLALYRYDMGGGGDVKLLAAIGALCRPLVGIEAEFYAFAAAALLAPAWLAWEGRLFKTLANTLWLAVNPFLPKAKRREIKRETLTWFRLGPAIFLGTLVAAALHWRPEAQ